MKSIDTKSDRNTDPRLRNILGAALALLFAISSWIGLRDTPGPMAAALVSEAPVATHAGDEARTNASPDALAKVDFETPASENPARGLNEPVSSDRFIGAGEASYYGRRFAGRATASGEVFDPAELTAAHRSLPFGSRLRVTNTANGRSVVVRVNDRGPYAENRLIDLSRAAAEQIGMIQSGTAHVELELITKA